MRLALIFNPFKYKVHEENIRVVQKYFGLFPPLSLAWVAAIAERAGHTVTIIDARTLDLSKEEVLASLREFKPDIIGFMMTTYMFPETLGWISFLKRRLNVPVVVGGYNLRVYPEESLFHDEIDFGCLKQAVNTVPQLLEELSNGRRRFAQVCGLVYKENGRIIVNPADPEPVDFNSFPFPARHLLPNHLYAEFTTQRRNFTVMITSLGCPNACGFCEAGRTPYSPREPKLVVDEMEECYFKYNIREIDIFDYQFTGIRKRFTRICDEIISRKLDLEWACRSRVDTVDEGLLEKMKLAGCRRIYFGIESGCQEILDRVNKGITLDQIRDTIRLTKSKGIQALGFFLVGAPGETRDTFRRTLRFAKELDLDYVQFSKCLAKPLTPLWRDLVERTGRDYWREWILGREVDRELPRPWTEIPGPQINCLAKKAYIAYHICPLRILKSVLAVRSFEEFKRKFLAFMDMMLRQENRAVEDRNFKAYRNVKPAAGISLRKKALIHTGKAFALLLFLVWGTGIGVCLPDAESDYYLSDPVAGHIHRPYASREYEFNGRKIILRTNNLGFREDSDTSIEKPQDTIRILVAGDSHIDGVCNNSESFPNVLETLMNSPDSKVKFEIINGGVGYYGFDNYELFLKKYLCLKPDVYICVVYTGNDFLDSARAIEGVDANPPRRPQGYAYHLQKCQQPGITSQVMNQVYYFKSFPSMKEKVLNRSLGIISSINSLCGGSGIAFTVILLATKADVEYDSDIRRLEAQRKCLGISRQDLLINRDLKNKVIDFLVRHNIEYIDSQEYMAAGNEDLFWSQDYHLNSRGHKLLAEAVYGKWRVLLAVPKAYARQER